MTCPMSDPSDPYSEQGSNTDTHPHTQTGDPRGGGTKYLKLHELHPNNDTSVTKEEDTGDTTEFRMMD